MPFIFDVNGDSLPDLIIGERSGNLNYFKNIGTDTLPDFDRNPTNSFFGKVDVVDRSSVQITGYSAPVFSTLDSTGKIYLLVGSESDGIKVYDFIRDSIDSGSFPKLFNRYSNIHEGERNTLTLADLNGDGKMEMVVGNYRGGLTFYTQSDSIAQPISSHITQPLPFDFMIYPVPAQKEIYFRLKTPYQGNILVNIYDITGRHIISEHFHNVAPGITFQIGIDTLPSGLYFTEFRSESQITTKKLIVR
jgi:hypothetical protein